MATEKIRKMVSGNRMDVGIMALSPRGRFSSISRPLLKKRLHDSAEQDHQAGARTGAGLVRISSEIRAATSPVVPAIRKARR